jgi:hypothetical protein
VIEGLKILRPDEEVRERLQKARRQDGQGQGKSGNVRALKRPWPDRNCHQKYEDLWQKQLAKEQEVLASKLLEDEIPRSSESAQVRRRRRQSGRVHKFYSGRRPQIRIGEERMNESGQGSRYGYSGWRRIPRAGEYREHDYPIERSLLADSFGSERHDDFDG